MLAEALLPDECTYNYEQKYNILIVKYIFFVCLHCHYISKIVFTWPQLEG